MVTCPARVPVATWHARRVGYVAVLTLHVFSSVLTSGEIGPQCVISLKSKHGYFTCLCTTGEEWKLIRWDFFVLSSLAGCISLLFAEHSALSARKHLSDQSLSLRPPL